MPKLQRQPAQHRRACDSVRHLHRSPNGYANEMESEMNAQNTPWLLKLHTKYPQDMVTPDGHYTVARTLPQPTIAVAVANARRLVACWNAFHGTSTLTIESMTKPVHEVLFDAGSRMNMGMPISALGTSQLRDENKVLQAQRDELLEACKMLIDHCDKHPPMGDSLWSVQLIRSAIKNAEGGSS